MKIKGRFIRVFDGKRISLCEGINWRRLFVKHLVASVPIRFDSICANLIEIETGD